MGRFLNSKKASLLFKDDAESTYFVDKTALLDELIPIIDPQALISDTTVSKENRRAEAANTSVSSAPAALENL